MKLSVLFSSPAKQYIDYESPITNWESYLERNAVLIGLKNEWQSSQTTRSELNYAVLIGLKMNGNPVKQRGQNLTIKTNQH